MEQQLGVRSINVGGCGRNESILAEHVDGNLAVSADDLFAQQPLGHVAT